MVRVAAVQEVELGIAQFVLANARLEVGSVAGNETGRLVDDVYGSMREGGLRKNHSKLLRSVFLG